MNASARRCFGEIFSGVRRAPPSLNIASPADSYYPSSPTHTYSQTTLSQFLLGLERPRGPPTRLTAPPHHHSPVHSSSSSCHPSLYLYARSLPPSLTHSLLRHFALLPVNLLTLPLPFFPVASHNEESSICKLCC